VKPYREDKTVKPYREDKTVKPYREDKTVKPYREGRAVKSDATARTGSVKRLAYITIVTAAGCLLLAACSSSSSTGNQGSSTSNQAAQDCGKTLKIGVVTDFTGDLGSFGKDDLNGFQLAVEQMNSSGALPSGWTAQTVVADAQGKSTVGVQLATQMMQAQHVSFIVGPSSGEIVGMVELAARYKVPVISQFAGTITLNTVGGKWIFRTVASDAYDGKAAAVWLSGQHVQNLVILVANDQSTVSVAHTTGNSLQALGGHVSKQIVFAPGQPSYQSVVSKALAAKPDYVFLAGGQSDGTTVVKELRDGGYNGPILVSSDMVVADVLKSLGLSRAKNLYGEQPVSDTQSSAYKQFAQTYTAKFNVPPGLFSANSYDAVMLGGLAAVAAKSTCGAALNSKIRDVANPPGAAVSDFATAVKTLAQGNKIDYSGASGPVDLDQSGTAQGSYAIEHAQQGAWQQIKFYPSATFK
jgi:branched-chain amino acid transport system substrate-binding protein